MEVCINDFATMLGNTGIVDNLYMQNMQICRLNLVCHAIYEMSAENTRDAKDGIWK